MNQKGFIPIIVIVAIVLVVTGGVGYFVAQTFMSVPEPTPSLVLTPAPVPTPIPPPSSEAEITIRTVGEKEGVHLIQKINPDSVETFVDAYNAVPISNPGGPQILYVGDDIGSYCAGISIKLTSIDYIGQRVVFTKTVGEPPPGGCPICLSGNTLIDTPSGLIPVRDIQIGMPIWTTDKDGNRITGIVTKTSKVPVLGIHQMIRLILNDGRELYVSPGHPTIDGRTVGDLAAGEIYDGARIVSVKSVPYNEGATYDILPSGDSGFYWANGVLLGSTLK